jgi:hypothetical protein
MAAASANAAVSAIGAHTADTETPQDAFAYFVNQLNKHGGLDGRKIQVIQDFINPISSDYDVQAASACADFTQDHHVAVVFSVETAYYSQAFSGCMANAHVPELLAVTGGIAPSTLAQYPTLFSPTAPTVNRRFAALINGLSSNGYFTKKTKVGVIVEDCPFNDAAYSATIAPMLKARGIPFTERGFSCVHGFESAAVVLAQIQNLVLPMRSAGVSRVMFVSGFETVASEFFERQANSQRYQPGYALTSTADIGDNAAGFSTSALSRVEGVGWDPDMDVTKLTTGSSATQRCRTLWAGYGPASNRINRYTNEMTCEEFFLMQAALQKTRAVSDAGTVESALESLGTSYTSPLLLGGAAKYGPSDKDGPTLFATFGFKAKCQCIAYTSAPKPLA